MIGAPPHFLRQHVKKLRVRISKFTSIYTGIYWSVIVTTTTGYGDLIPLTTLGKIISPNDWMKEKWGREKPGQLTGAKCSTAAHLMALDGRQAAPKKY